MRFGTVQWGMEAVMREDRSVSLRVDLPPLPVLSDRRLAVRLTSDAFRQVRGGHPWVYGDSIAFVSNEDADPGTLAVIFDDKRDFAAIGLWDPTSPIRIRVLHAGKPAKVDADFFAKVLINAYDARSELADSGTTGWRWVNGENDGLGGLIVDRYDTTLVIKVYTPAWLPHFRSIVDALIGIDNPQRIVLRLGRNMEQSSEVISAGLNDGMTIYGPAAHGPVEFEENGLVFGADVVNGQKTGHFLDQRDNRAIIASFSKDKDVLDVFSCTGGFTVHAAAGGARSVHSVDIADPAIATAIDNMERNDLGDVPHRRSVGDAFEVLAELAESDERYDVVIVDPPAFASRASERDRAIRAYRKLTELALQVLRPGGRLFQASCSSRVTEDELLATVRAAVSGQGREIEELQVFGHAVDHPVSFTQGTYLKAVTGIIR